MGEFYYQTHHVLERHLKVGVKMSLNDMVDILLLNILILKLCSITDLLHRDRGWGGGGARPASEGDDLGSEWR